MPAQDREHLKIELQQVNQQITQQTQIHGMEVGILTNTHRYGTNTTFCIENN